MRIISWAVCWCRKAASRRAFPTWSGRKWPSRTPGRLYYYLGKAKLRLEKPAEAVVLLQRAVTLNPADEALAYYELGRALKACGREAEARTALARVHDLQAAAAEAAKLDGKVAGAR